MSRDPQFSVVATLRDIGAVNAYPADEVEYEPYGQARRISPGDFDRGGTVSIDDLLTWFLPAYCTGSPAADVNLDGSVSVQDIFNYLAGFFVGAARADTSRARLGRDPYDHYHRENPNTTGNMDRYLDKDGKPVPKGSEPSHLEPTRPGPRPGGGLSHVDPPRPRPRK